MGSWRNRPRFHRHTPRTPLESSYYDPNSPPYGSSDDGVPPWEKKFCWSVGSVPWRKVVQAKSFISCHATVINWDDSAAAEAFHIAKKRFWLQWSGLPCDISLPDPNMYVDDDINWNSVIDPELIADLEKEYFVPPDEEWHDSKLGHKNKETRDSKVLLAEECNHECSNDVGTSELLRNEDVSKGRNQWDSSIDNNAADSSISENPWEPKVTQGNEISSTNAWGGLNGRESDKGWGSRAQEDKGWQRKGLGYNGRESNEWEDKGWKSKVRDRGDASWGSNWHDNKLQNVRQNSWGCKSVKSNAPRTDNGWQNNGVSPRGWRTPGTNNAEQKKREFKRPCDDWGDSTRVSQKREGNFGHRSGNRNSRLRRHNDE